MSLEGDIQTPGQGKGGGLTKEEVEAIAKAVADELANLPIHAVVSAAGALAIHEFTPVDAEAGALTMTLPEGEEAGTLIAVEKNDSSAHAVTVEGKLRGAAVTTYPLTAQHQGVMLEADEHGYWWPIAAIGAQESVALIAEEVGANATLEWGHAYLVNASGLPAKVKLPPATGNSGKTLLVKVAPSATAPVVLEPHGTEKINGELATLALSQLEGADEFRSVQLIAIANNPEVF